MTMAKVNTVPADAMVTGVTVPTGGLGPSHITNVFWAYAPNFIKDKHFCGNANDDEIIKD